MDQFQGLPTHPLIVHIPVAMLPLAAFGVLVMLIKRQWYDRYKWAVLLVGAIGAFGTFLATASGEGLQSLMTKRGGEDALRNIHDHAQAGELARTLAVAFFGALAAWVVIPWFLERQAGKAVEGAPVRMLKPWMQSMLMAAVAITAIASVASVIAAGHSGASSAWDAYNTSSVDHDGDSD